jgi:hypothetical protein
LRLPALTARAQVSMSARILSSFDMHLLLRCSPRHCF